MTSGKNVVHIHLGVDGVLENIFDLLYQGGALNPENSNTSYMNPNTYREQFRQAVDSAMLPILRYPSDPTGRDLLISRPRMLYPGAPLNCIGPERLPLAKLEHLQHIFSDYKVKFHLLLTDHVSYLYMHQKFLSKNAQQTSTVSWQTLIQSIRSKLLGDSKLCIWNAEDSELFLMAFLKNGLKIPEADWPMLLKASEPAALNSPSVSECEAFIKAYGLDQDYLDLNYEDDLRRTRDE